MDGGNPEKITVGSEIPADVFNRVKDENISLSKAAVKCNATLRAIREACYHYGLDEWRPTPTTSQRFGIWIKKGGQKDTRFGVKLYVGEGENAKVEIRFFNASSSFGYFKRIVSEVEGADGNPLGDCLKISFLDDSGEKIRLTKAIHWDNVLDSYLKTSMTSPLKVIIHVQNSTGTGIGFLKISEVNRLSQLPKTLEERRRLIAEDCMSSSEVKCKEEAEHQFGPFMNEGSRNLTLSACTSKRTRDVSGNSEWQQPDFVKRELSDECETQIGSGQEDSSFFKIHLSVWNRFLENTGHSASNSNSSVRYPVDDELIIRAEYGDQGTLLYLPISSTYVDIMKNIDEAYNLVPGSYALHYLDDRNQWIMLDDDEDWVNCLMHWRITGAQTIQVRLQEPTRRYPKILNRNSLPQICKVLKKRSRLVKCISSSEVKSKNPLFPLPLADGKHFRRSANEAVGNLTVWQGPNFVKRMLSDLCESQSDSNQKDNEANQKLYAGSNSMCYTGDDELIVNTEYGDHHTVLYVPISSKVADIKKNVDEKYKLDPNTFKLEFLDFEDKWIRLDYDRDWECCIKSSRTADIQTIRMRVLLKH